MSPNRRNRTGFMIELHLRESGESVEHRKVLRSRESLQNICLLGNRVLIRNCGFVKPLPVDAKSRLAITVDYDDRSAPRALALLDHILFKPQVDLLVNEFSFSRGSVIRSHRDGSRSWN